MKHWKNGSVQNWQEQEKGKFLSFKANAPRRIKFEVMGVGKVEVWSTTDDGKSEMLQGIGNDEKFHIETITDTDIDFLIKTEKNCKVYLNVPDLDQNVVPKYADESFVNLEPRIAQNPDLVRMQNMFKNTVAALQNQISVQAQQLKEEKPKDQVQPVVEPVEEKEVENVAGDQAAS